MRRQAERFGTEFVDDDVVGVDLSSRPFEVKTAERTWRARAIIVATGASARLLGLESERRLGLDKVATYRRFAQKTMQLKEDLQRTLKEFRANGKRIVGYGAPAKGNTLLGFLEIGPDLIEYIADKSPLKQGRYCPGVHIPVVPPAKLLADQPDYVVLLAWNFVDEILSQQEEYRRRGGKFIVPVPDVKILA